MCIILGNSLNANSINSGDRITLFVSHNCTEEQSQTNYAMTSCCKRKRMEIHDFSNTTKKEARS